MIGKIYNHLTVLRYGPTKITKTGQSLKTAHCKCICGETVQYNCNSLIYGRAKSCGCKRKGSRLKRKTIRSGLSKNPIYNAFKLMHYRCYDRSDDAYKNYGGRGIRIAKCWHGDSGFRNFVSWAESNGYRQGLDIDRIDNNKNYSPKNCRFVTPKVNNANRRNTAKVKHQGNIIPFTVYYEKLHHPKVTYNVARSRYYSYGWSAKKSVQTPPLKRSQWSTK